MRGMRSLFSAELRPGCGRFAAHLVTGDSGADVMTCVMSGVSERGIAEVSCGSSPDARAPRPDVLASTVPSTRSDAKNDESGIGNRRMRCASTLVGSKALRYT